jgi:penicillin-binding protein 1A
MEPQRLISLKAALQEQRKTRYQLIVRWMWFILCGGLSALTIIFFLISFLAIPSFRELEDPASALASEVLANNNEVLGRFFIENRVPVPYEELNPHLVNALVSTEDERFRDHCGVDSRAMLRVIVRTILLRDQSAGGGSTLTQQLAKNLYSTRDFKDMNKVQKYTALVYSKLREWITAIKLEKAYTKEEILAMYLNQFNFINNAFGIHAASEVYFSKDQSKLTVPEAATLVGMLKNPSYFNPNRFPERMIRRRWVVLSQMKRNHFLSEAQFDAFKVSPLALNFKQVSFSDDKAPYLCDVLEKEVQSILKAPDRRKTDGSMYNIYRDGLKIYTTIDPVYQQHAEEAMQEQMKKLQQRYFTVWKNRDPWTFRGRETTDEEIQMRQDDLWKHIRDGDRFQNLRPKYMDAICSKAQKKYDFELRDIDIERMLLEDRKPGIIAKMLSAKPPEVTLEQAAAYRKIMTGAEWPEIKSQYRLLRAMVMKEYGVKQKMKVFSWFGGPKFERDTIMTPMDSLKYHRMFLQTGILAVDPTNSEVKAWVGGINFKHFQFDHIRTDRQVGSTFKPYVYATAIAQQGVSPCFPVYDQEVTIPARYMNFTHTKDWTPKNSHPFTGAKLTLFEALKGSVNSASAFLMKQMGDTEPVRGLINNMGIDSAARRPDGQYRVPKQPSICLGASDLTVFEMTGAYATFANNGMYGKPYVIRKIEDKNGKVLWRSLLEEKVALPPNANYVMLEMLKYNVKGTPGINTLKSEIGGKTGTTNFYTDGWFMGVTPRLVVGTWVGGEDRWIRFTSFEDGQGARMARPICAGFISRLEKDPKSGYDYNARFKRPEGDLGIEINCNAYKDGLPPTNGDEEQFAPDKFNDQLDENGKPPGKKPDDTFGDELHNG